jgi:hypothetical protein
MTPQKSLRFAPLIRVSTPSPLAFEKIKAIAKKAGIKIEDPKLRVRPNRQRRK